MRQSRPRVVFLSLETKQPEFQYGFLDDDKMLEYRKKLKNGQARAIPTTGTYFFLQDLVNNESFTTVYLWF